LHKVSRCPSRAPYRRVAKERHTSVQLIPRHGPPLRPAPLQRRDEPRARHRPRRRQRRALQARCQEAGADALGSWPSPIRGSGETGGQTREGFSSGGMAGSRVPRSSYRKRCGFQASVTARRRHLARHRVLIAVAASSGEHVGGLRCLPYPLVGTGYGRDYPVEEWAAKSLC
jgi:hypothetical protein